MKSTALKWGPPPSPGLVTTLWGEVLDTRVRGVRHLGAQRSGKEVKDPGTAAHSHCKHKSEPDEEKTSYTPGWSHGLSSFWESYLERTLSAGPDSGENLHGATKRMAALVETATAWLEMAPALQD